MFRLSVYQLHFVEYLLSHAKLRILEHNKYSDNYCNRSMELLVDTKIFSLLAAGESPDWVEHEVKTSSFQKQSMRLRWFKLENRIETC